MVPFAYVSVSKLPRVDIDDTLHRPRLFTGRRIVKKRGVLFLSIWVDIMVIELTSHLVSE
jgi:hypothetical protein